jgi:hypothetical protein
MVGSFCLVVDGCLVGLAQGLVDLWLAKAPEIEFALPVVVAFLAFRNHFTSLFDQHFAASNLTFGTRT